MPLNLTSPETEFAVESVRQASLLVDAVRREMAAATLTKKDDSPVTVADFAAQALVAAGLAEKFPKDPLVGEESAAALKCGEGKETLNKITEFVRRFIPSAPPEKICDWIDRGQGDPAGRFWVMDPIDGTKGFLRGDQYAVALALIIDGDVKIGVLGCPHLTEGSKPDVKGPGTLALAVRGQGSWRKPLKKKGKWQPLKVSNHRDTAECILLRSFESSHTDSPRMNQLIKQMGIRQPALLMDSLAKYTVLASGAADLLIRLRAACSPDQGEYIWDQAPGAIIVEEAGGQVTDLDGKPLDYTSGRTLNRNCGVLISNRHFHAAALKALETLKGRKEK